MARKSRDHKAENARRNEKARAAGFSSRATMRKAIEKGTYERPVTTSRVEPYRRAGFDSPKEYRDARRDAKKWADENSKNPHSAFPARASPETFRAYINAFPPEGNRGFVNHAHKMAALRHYLVDVMGYMTDEEFDDQYPDA